MSPSNAQYRVIFSGEVQPSEDVENVAKRLAVLLKMSPATARGLISRRPRPVPKALDLATAEKLKHLIVKAGADCYIEQIEEPLPRSINRGEAPEGPRPRPRSLRPHSQPIGPASEELAPRGWGLEPVVYTPPSKSEKPESQSPREPELSLGGLALAEIEELPAEPDPFKKPDIIVCPKCGHEQPPAEECRACGIIFHKYQPRENQASETPPATPKPAARPRQSRTRIDPGVQAIQDLELFLGTNVQTYMDRFDNFRDGTGERFALTWHWPALFVPFFWAIYRKLWLWALLIFISGVFLPLISNVGWALTANYIYFRHARGSIKRVRRLFGKADPETRIAQAGGTSAGAVWASVILIVLLNYLVFKVILSPFLDLAGDMSDAMVTPHQAQNQLGPDLADDPNAVSTLTSLGFTGVVVKIWLMGPGKGRSPDEVTWSDMNLADKQPVDAWNNPIRYQGYPDSFELRSAGPDGQFDSSDDITRTMLVH